ncbi:MAG: DUF2800 domain-containing protein [Clostridia bacterium]|nr:DUF2800 domain-containing protein [Clostridia bacterium]
MPTQHAFLSASSAHRWLECTAAPKFEAQFPAGTSEYAEEGTLAHSICELFARRKFSDLPTRKFNCELKKLQAKDYYSDEMLTTADTYVQYIAEKSLSYATQPYVTFEVRVNFSDVVPDGFGTCDCVMIGDSHLQIVDYKHGKGVAVSAQNNPQMRLYALGALKLYGAVYGEIKTVGMAICQPRLSQDASEEEITVKELLEWGEKYVKPRAEAAASGCGEFHPGEHCRFCKGKAQCRARANCFTAFEDFKDCVPEGSASFMAEQISENEMLSNAEVGDLLIRAKGLVQWYSDLQDYAQKELLDGRKVEGWKLVEGRSNRAFTDGDAAFKKLTDNGYDESLLYDRKPKTLTEIEKLLGKKEFGALLSEYVNKPKGKPTLAPQSDVRAEYNSAALDFKDIANG